MRLEIEMYEIEMYEIEIGYAIILGDFIYHIRWQLAPSNCKVRKINI